MERGIKLSNLFDCERDIQIKTLVFSFLLIFSVGCFALPDCPKDQTKRYHNCYGTYTFGSGPNEGDKYVGEFKDNKFHGQGTYTYADGQKYVGEWKDDKGHGQGTYTRADGAKYVGEFKDGQPHGQGTYTWSNGIKFSGKWENGEMLNHLEPISGLFLSSEEKCVNAQIAGWNATENGDYTSKYINQKYYENKEQFLAWAWRQCKEK